MTSKDIIFLGNSPRPLCLLPSLILLLYSSPTAITIPVFFYLITLIFCVFYLLRYQEKGQRLKSEILLSLSWQKFCLFKNTHSEVSSDWDLGKLSRTKRYLRQLLVRVPQVTWGIVPASYRRIQRQKSNGDITARTNEINMCINI